MKVKKLVILAAGMGTRFLPVTKAVSKEMLPLIDKPTIQYLVDEGIESGIEEVIIVISNKREALKNYFGKDEELEEKLKETGKTDFLEIVRKVSSVNVKYVLQDKPLGSGYALSMVKNHIGDEPFAVMYCDDVVKGDVPALSEAIAVYEKTGKNVMGVVEVPHELTYKYGIMEVDEDMKVRNIIEKPKVEDAPSNLASIGRIILTPDIFPILETIPRVKGEYYLTSALEKIVKDGNMYSCKFSGTYYDTGIKIGYLKATLAYALDREEFRDEIIEFVENHK